MITTAQLVRVGEATLLDARAASLRQRFPELHFTECSEDDVSPRFQAAFSVEGYDLYLINGAMTKLQDAGATEVVPEAIEGSLMLASHALALVGVPMRRVIRSVQDQREARYQLLRGYFHGADDDTSAEREQARLVPLTLPAGELLA